MHRRQFLTAASISSVLGTWAPAAGLSCGDASRPPETSNLRTPLCSYTAEDHRRRLENIGICTKNIRKCMRKHLITNYLPGQCIYNLTIGGRGHLGPSGDQRFRYVCPATADRLRGFRLREPRPIPGLGQLQQHSGGSHHFGRLRAGFGTIRTGQKGVDPPRAVASHPAPRTRIVAAR